MKDSENKQDAQDARAGRWKLALHEAGHVIVAWALSRRSQLSGAVLLPTTDTLGRRGPSMKPADRLADLPQWACGGLAYTPALPPLHAGIVIAAGTVAEGLAEIAKPPRRHRAEAPTAAREEVIDKQSMAGVIGDYQKSPPDRQALALLCVKECDGDFDKCLVLYQHIQHETRLLVRALSPQIIRAARHLCRTGLLLPSDLAKIFTQSASNKAREIGASIMSEMTLQERLDGLRRNSPEYKALIAALNANTPRHRVEALAAAACTTAPEVAELVSAIRRAEDWREEAPKADGLNQELAKLAREIADLAKRIGKAQCDDDRNALRVQHADLSARHNALIAPASRATQAAKGLGALREQGIITD